jgi:hypothetical protein
MMRLPKFSKALIPAGIFTVIIDNRWHESDVIPVIGILQSHSDECI